MISFYTPPLRFDLPVMAFKDGVAMVLEAVTGCAKICGRDVCLKPFCIWVCGVCVCEIFIC